MIRYLSLPSVGGKRDASSISSIFAIGNIFIYNPNTYHFRIFINLPKFLFSLFFREFLAIQGENFRQILDSSFYNLSSPQRLNQLKARIQRFKRGNNVLPPYN